jgi:hypothetical protein
MVSENGKMRENTQSLERLRVLILQWIVKCLAMFASAVFVEVLLCDFVGECSLESALSAAFEVLRSFKLLRFRFMKCMAIGE